MSVWIAHIWPRLSAPTLLIFFWGPQGSERVLFLFCSPPKPQSGSPRELSPAVPLGARLEQECPLPSSQPPFVTGATAGTLPEPRILVIVSLILSEKMIACKTMHMSICHLCRFPPQHTLWTTLSTTFQHFTFKCEPQAYERENLDVAWNRNIHVNVDLSLSSYWGYSFEQETREAGLKLVPLRYSVTFKE